ncbi:hypothetical protein C8R48DRAFT_780144 [Suillus tomentosus]|nr:hypothetical protein C8R48DRAFT_780144 [Suillus tomentosus]
MNIFEIATRTRHGAAAGILYQQRTKSWFEKTLYEKVLLPGDEIAQEFLECLRRRKMPEEFAEKSIKAICLSGDVEFNTVMEILSLCKGIKNLALLPDSEDFQKDVSTVLQSLDALPLKVLSLQIGVHLTDTLISHASYLSTITHLEIDRYSMTRDIDIQRFPNLTHLAIWSTINSQEGMKPSLLKRLLSHPALEVLVLRAEGHKTLAEFLERHMIYDPRIVLATSRVYIWDDLGRACMTFWELADEKANLTEPNHNKHRCFTRTTLINRISDLMEIEHVPEDDLDHESFQCRIIGNDGTVTWGYYSNTSDGMPMIEDSDYDTEEGEDYDNPHEEEGEYAPDEDGSDADAGHDDTDEVDSDGGHGE